MVIKSEEQAELEKKANAVMMHVLNELTNYKSDDKGRVYMLGIIIARLTAFMELQMPNATDVATGQIIIRSLVLAEKDSIQLRAKQAGVDLS